nr:ATP-dependent RNA helicase [Ipomoea batatas]
MKMVSAKAEELFRKLICMIANILAACLTNLPHMIYTKCISSAIDERLESVRDAAIIFGETEDILKLFEECKLSSAGPSQPLCIDEWREWIEQQATTISSSATSNGASSVESNEHVYGHGPGPQGIGHQEIGLASSIELKPLLRPRAGMVFLLPSGLCRDIEHSFNEYLMNEILGLDRDCGEWNRLPGYPGSNSYYPSQEQCSVFLGIPFPGTRTMFRVLGNTLPRNNVPCSWEYKRNRKNITKASPQEVTYFRGNLKLPKISLPLYWPANVLAANSMYKITRTILLYYEDGECQAEELFRKLIFMIANILAACLTNLPHMIYTKCISRAIDERIESVQDAAIIFGETEDILKLFEECKLSSAGPSQPLCIDEWREWIEQQATTISSSATSNGASSVESNEHVVLQMQA